MKDKEKKRKKNLKNTRTRTRVKTCTKNTQSTCQNAHQHTCVKTCTKTRVKTRTSTRVSKHAPKHVPKRAQNKCQNAQPKHVSKRATKTRVKTCNNQRSATFRIKGHTSELLLKKLTQLCYLLSENTQMFGLVAGRQKRALKPLQPTGLAVNLTTLPQQLGKLGYQTHMVGKWHLGKTACTPEVPL